MPLTRTADPDVSTPGSPAAPARPPAFPPRPGRPAVPTHPQPTPAAPDWPTWWQRNLPTPARNLLVDLGLWHAPTPLRPSLHLAQTVAVLTRYGWGQSVDYAPTGRMCARGAMNLLETTGHVTPASRARAVAYLQHALHQQGVRMDFAAWNDLPDQQFPAVRTLLVTAAHHAARNGE